MPDGFFSTFAFLTRQRASFSPKILLPTSNVCLQPAMSLGPHWCPICERGSPPQANHARKGIVSEQHEQSFAPPFSRVSTRARLREHHHPGAIGASP